MRSAVRRSMADRGTPAPHAGPCRHVSSLLSRIERRAQIDAFNHRGEFVSDRVEPHGHLRVLPISNITRSGRGRHAGLGMSALASWRFDKVNSSTAKKRKPVMSAMPPIATPCVASKLSRSAKTGCEQSQQNLRLFDHLVGAGEQRCGNFDAETSWPFAAQAARRRNRRRGRFIAFSARHPGGAP
jgi:hypothetical protein